MRLFTLLSVASPLAWAFVLPSTKVSYDGYKVVRLAVGTDAGKVTDLVNDLQLSTWKGKPRAGRFADIVIPPGKIDAFNSATEGMEAVTMHEDLGASIAVEGNFDTFAAGAVNATWFNSYHAYADHQSWLQSLQSQFPSQAELVSSGTSLQGKTIQGIHFWGSAGKGIKPAIVIHGTVHAREWIATMVVEYFAYNLLTNYASSAQIKAFVDAYDFYIFPIVNVDGFIYSQTTDRMWRKNRQTTTGSTCLGHDINRNWNYEWSVLGGASTDPCAEDFKGVAAFDAPETQTLAKYLQSLKNGQGLKMYIDYHSYSQLFMTPYGYSCSALPSNNAEYQSLAKGAVAAIKAVHGTSFQYGPICTTIYQATGTSVDYVNDVVKADYSFTSELRDTGIYGFVLPANQILPSGEEAFAGFQYLLQNIK